MTKFWIITCLNTTYYKKVIIRFLVILVDRYLLLIRKSSKKNHSFVLRQRSETFYSSDSIFWINNSFITFLD